MLKTFRSTLLPAAAIAAVLLAPSAWADIGFSLSPSTQTATVGNSLSYDLLVSGLTSGSQALGDYDISVLFSPSIVTPTLVTFANRLGDPTVSEVVQLNFFYPAAVELFESSLLSPADLVTRQIHSGSSFALATLTFDALAVGTSPLSLFVASADDQGANPFSFTTTGAEAIVQSGGSAVPEPSAAWLLLTAAVGAWALRRRAARN